MSQEAAVKLKMAKNSLFAILLRSRWWISFVIALALGLLGAMALPDGYRVAGALSGFPFVVIGVMAAWRQWHQPSAARIEATQQALAAMAWPAFSTLLEQAFQRDGYVVQRSAKPPADFRLERSGRRMLVCARRWKSARIGLQDLRALQTARAADDISDALYIGLGELSDNARPFADQHGITIWHAGELAHALRGLQPGR
jgi:restriction system protein